MFEVPTDSQTLNKPDELRKTVCAWCSKVVEKQWSFYVPGSIATFSRPQMQKRTSEMDFSANFASTYVLFIFIRLFIT